VYHINRFKLSFAVLAKEGLKLSCDSHFQRAFTACVCIFKVITLVGANQGNYVENATACSKRTLKTTVVTQLNVPKSKSQIAF